MKLLMLLALVVEKWRKLDWTQRWCMVAFPVLVVIYGWAFWTSPARLAKSPHTIELINVVDHGYADGGDISFGGSPYVMTDKGERLWVSPKVKAKLAEGNHEVEVGGRNDPWLSPTIEAVFNEESQ